MLIPSERHTAKDLELWAAHEEADLIHAQSASFERRVDRSIDAIVHFARKPCYAGISWGKDSTVLAHLIWRCLPILGQAIPCFWIRVEPIANPDCSLVCDAFLEQWFLDYREITVWCRRDLLGWHATGTLEQGFSEAIEQSRSTRHISAVRGDESGERMLRMRRWGVETAHSCAPLGWWTAADVFAYLAVHRLPVHPVYAMLGGGRYPRQHLRVASMGGRRGDGAGRAQWEREYYGDVLNRLEAHA